MTRPGKRDGIQPVDATKVVSSQLRPCQGLIVRTDSDEEHAHLVLRNEGYRGCAPSVTVTRQG